MRRYGRILFLLFTILFLVGYYFFRKIYTPNVFVPKEEEEVVLYIPTDSSYDDVLHIFDTMNIVQNMGSLEWVAEKMEYPSLVKPGRYVLRENMSNRDFINILRAVQQKPLGVVFNSINNIRELER